MALLLALLLAQTELSDEECARLLAEHKGLLLQLADSPIAGDMARARVKRAKAKEEALAFANGACHCGAATHGACKSKETCDPICDPIRSRLLAAFKAANDEVKRLEGGPGGAQVLTREKRVREIAALLGVDVRLYELSQADIDDALARMNRARGHWNTARDRIAAIRKDMSADVEATLREARRARAKAWADVAVDALSCGMGSAKLKELLPAEKHRVMADAGVAFVGLVRDLWDQVTRGEAVKGAELFKNITDSVSTLRGLLAGIAAEEAVCTLNAINKIYATVSTLSSGGQKALEGTEFWARLGEAGEAIIGAAAVWSPVAAAGQAGGRVAQAVYVSVKLDDSIGDMKAALDKTGEDATLAERRLRALDRRIAAYEQQRRHARD